MQTTTTTLNRYRDKELEGLSLEKLSSIYRETHYDSVIAEAFERVKKLIVINNRRYPHFEIDDYVSFALEKLTMCLLTYVPGSSNKFSTYFSKVYSNHLRYETKQQNTHKRCIMFHTNSLTTMLENGFDIESRVSEHNYVHLPSTLTKNERIYCELIIMNYGTNKEIAEFMNVSTMTLCNMRKSLRLKLKELYNIE